MEYMDRENPERVFYEHEILIDAFLPETDQHPDWFNELIAENKVEAIKNNDLYCYSVGLHGFRWGDHPLHVPKEYYLCRVLFLDTRAAIQNRYGRTPEHVRKVGDLFCLDQKNLFENYEPHDGRFHRRGYFDVYTPKKITVREEMEDNPEIASRFTALGLTLKVHTSTCDIFQGERIVKESLQEITEIVTFLEGCELGTSLCKV